MSRNPARLITVLLSLAVAFVGAQAKEDAPTPFNAYDGMAPGARALGMGYAFSAMTGDPSMVYYNPAGLSGIAGNSFSATIEAARQSTLPYELVASSEPVRGRNLQYLVFAIPKSAFSWHPLSDMQLHQTGAGGWRDTEIKINAYTVSAAHAFDNGLISGLNLSYLSGRIAQSGVENNAPFANIADGYGYSFDFGLQYELSPQFRLGLNAQNLLGTMVWDDFRSDDLPLTLRGGMVFQIARFLAFATDYEKRYYRKPTDSPDTITHLGLEQSIGNVLAVRVGTYGHDLNDLNTSHLTAGLGYQQNGYSLSLAGDRYKFGTEEVNRYVFEVTLQLK